MKRKIKKNKETLDERQIHSSRKSVNVGTEAVSLSKEQIFQLGLQCYHAGDFDQAEKFFQHLLGVELYNAEAYHLLGVITAQQGKAHELAIDYIHKSLSINNNNPAVYNNLGHILHEAGKLPEAINSYRQALSIRPGYAEAQNNLGVVLNESGKQEEAIASYRKALSINADFAEAHNNLGVVLHQLGKVKEAIPSFRRALSINPGYAEAHNNLGLALQATGRTEEAATCYRQALSLNINYATAHNNLGLALQELGRLKEAAASYRQALSEDPDYVLAHNNLGNILQKWGKLKEAILCFKRALSLKPDYAEAYNNLGVVLKKTGRIDESIACFKKAMSIKPVLDSAHSNLLFNLNYSPNITQEEIFGESLRFADLKTADMNFTEHFPAKRDMESRKLKIGYVSPDFRRHSVAFFIAPLLKAHNREKFEIYCYSDVEKPDTVTEQIQKKSDHWRLIAGKDDTDSIAQIKHDRIDILVDLAGHSDGNRLLMFARKPAPVQVSWLGYPNTTGLRAIDYRFTDAIADPPGTGDEFYSEELIRLKNGFLCYQPDKNAPEVSVSPCLESDIITFGSFNNLTKVTPEVIGLWAEILLRAPKSRLVMKSKQLSDESVRMDCKEKFARRGISPDRIELMGMVPGIVNHLAAYNTIDIALDPFPYNGTTTTCEALWMGVPVITLRGNRHSGRVGASLLHTIGMTDSLVAESKDSYIEKAVAWAKDKEGLNNMRMVLRQQVQYSPLCDAESFAQKIEKAYLGMWSKYTGSHGKEKKNKKKSELLYTYKPENVAGQSIPLSSDQAFQLVLQNFQAGNLLQAERLCRQLLDADPDHADGNHLMGVIASKQEGNHNIAVQYIQKAIQLNPAEAGFHNNLGYIYKQNGNMEEAIDCYRRALTITPKDAVIHNNLGNALQKLNRAPEAATCYRNALKNNPDFAEAHNNLGLVLQELNRPDEAIYNFRQALSLKPDYPEAHFNLAVTFKQMGRMKESVASFRKALAIKPDYSLAYSGLSTLVRHKEYDDEIKLMEELYDKPDTVDEDKIQLGFALGKIYGDLKKYEKSFDFYLKANLLRRGTYDYAIQTDQDLFNRIKMVFSAAFFSSTKGPGNKNATPIFILGMPRSGTTLIEQILSSHPQVYGAGELYFLAELIRGLCPGESINKYPESIATLDADALKRIGTDYIYKIRGLSSEAKYITDKMPHNFLLVGLIKTVLPNAKVIHCMRNPMDNCFSLFKNVFSKKKGHKYAYDLVELGRYYSLYLDLMNHWENKLPGFMYKIQYEEMVYDQENQTRKLLEFCGLPWDDGCLEFHNAERRIVTASSVQVRQPMYKDSVGLWKQYEKQLEPLYKSIYS